MGTRVIMMEDDLVLFTRSFDIDDFMKAVELGQIDFSVDVELPFPFFVWDSPFLTLIVVIPPIAIAIRDYLPVNDPACVPPNASRCLLAMNNFWDAFWCLTHRNTRHLSFDVFEE